MQLLQDLFAEENHFMAFSLQVFAINKLLSLNFSRSDPGQSDKINLNFYFHTFWSCFKKFYKGLKGLYKTFSGTTKKCENKKLILF